MSDPMKGLAGTWQMVKEVDDPSNPYIHLEMNIDPPHSPWVVRFGDERYENPTFDTKNDMLEFGSPDGTITYRGHLSIVLDKKLQEQKMLSGFWWNDSGNFTWYAYLVKSIPVK